MASENSGGGKSKIVTANQREGRVPAKPFTQTLNKYGTSDTNSRPVNKDPIKTPDKAPPIKTPDKAPPKQADDSDAAGKTMLDVIAASGVDLYKDPDLVTSFGTAVAATPSTPPAIPPITAAVAVIATPPVKTAPIDTVLFDDDIIPIEVMTDLIFENIGGHEIINIARNDIINGQEVSYQPIKNLSSIQQQYNPNNILSLQSTSDKYFANFAIKLENKIPNPGNGPDGIYVYLDDDTGNMIVEADNLELDEQIQIEITTSGTIYEAEFGESNS